MLVTCSPPNTAPTEETGAYIEEDHPEEDIAANGWDVGVLRGQNPLK